MFTNFKLRFFTLLFFCLPLLILSGQAPNLDSLWNVWNDESQADTARLKAIHEIAWNGYLFRKPDSAFYFAQIEYEFAQNKSLNKYMANALNTQGVSYCNRDDYQKAIIYFKKSLNLRKKGEHKSEIGSSLGNLGIAYQKLGDYNTALKYYQESLEISKKIAHKKGAANALGNIGNIYHAQGYYPKALDYHQKALTIEEAIGDKNRIAATLNNIGNVYTRQNEFSKALDLYHKSIELRKETGHQLGMVRSLTNSGDIYQKLRNYSKAFHYHNQALKISEASGSKSGMAGSLKSLGNIYQYKGNHSKALNYYQKSLDISREIGDKKEMADALSLISFIQYNMGNYEEAIEICHKSLQIAQEIGHLTVATNACEGLFILYKTTNNWQKALEYHEQMAKFKDSLFNQANTQELTRLQMQYEFDKQHLADSLQQQEEKLKIELAYQEEVRKKDRNQNLSIGAGLFLLLISGGLYGRVRHIRKSKATIETERDRSDMLLHNILPADVAAELKENGNSEARDFEEVTVLFTDFVGFTETAGKLSAQELVAEVNTCFKAFDEIIDKYQIEKIKTIGDAYMAAGGLKTPKISEPKGVVKAAFEMQLFMKNRYAERSAQNLPAFEMRVGIHTGPVVAGIVGVKKFQYDIWGDTVNTASRMESNGEVGKVNISNDTYELIKDDSLFTFESRGKVNVKGKGEMEMWFVTLTENQDDPA